jgi:hypothetical protein
VISAFGALAEPYARGLGAIDAIVAEPATIADAYLEAVRRRERGTPFYGMLLLDDPRAACTNRWAQHVLTNVADYDLQLTAMEQLAAGVATLDSRPASEHWKVDPALVAAIGDFYRLADTMLVRSFTEFGRIADLFDAKYRPMCPVERVIVEPDVPAVERRRPDRPGLVIWAPKRPAMELALHGFALREFFGDALYVTGGGPLPHLPGAVFVSPDDPRVRTALATAAAIVCAETSDPGDAVAFARRGYGVVAPFGSGAHEFAGEVIPWDGTAAQLPHCVAIALGRPAAFRAAGPLPAAPLVPALPVPADELPLVSVVCPTYNRPHDLRLMLECIAAQTYPNLECIIVNDAGSPVADVVAAFPFARLIDLAENGGASKALEIGVREARGEYVQLMADDDLLYPDHLVRVVGALLRSGAMVAHGSGLSRQVDRLGDGVYKTRGLSCLTFFGTATPTEALVAVPMYYHQLVQHRTTFEAVGWLRRDMALADQEMLLRLAQRYTFAWVDHVTSEFRDHLGGMGKGFDHLAEQRRIYEEIHPVPGRPVLAKRRESALQGVAERVPGQPAFLSVLRLPD